MLKKNITAAAITSVACGTRVFCAYSAMVITTAEKATPKIVAGISQATACGSPG